MAAGIAIKAGNLLSRAKRKEVTGGNLKRRISTALRFSDAGQENSGGNILQRWLFNPARRLVGWILNKVWNIVRNINITQIFQWIVNGGMALARFDWNASDAEIRQMQRNNNLTMAAVWGSFVGQGFGWLTGIAVGAGIAYLVPVIGGATLAKTMASKVGTEALDELYYGLLGAVGQTARSLSTNVALTAYMQIRRLLKRAPFGSLIAVFGEENAQFIRDQWGNEGGPNLSFANQVEERIERIGSDYLRTFIEAGFDEFWDGFMEAGFIVAQELDDAYAQARMAQQVHGDGEQRGLYLTPDKEAPDERIYLEGPEKPLRQQVISTLATHRMVYNRDMGQIVGMPARDWYKANPHRRKATIVFRSSPRPPWRGDDGERAQEATYSIPDLKIGVTWADLKAFVKPFTWGEWRATAKLKNGRQMAVYGATAQEAENTLERLLRLSTTEIVALNTSQEKRRNIKLKKRPIRMYPCYATLLVRTPSVDLTGRTDLSGTTWDERKERVLLWRDHPPSDDFIWS
jgi:hypothetical protein